MKVWKKGILLAAAFTVALGLSACQRPEAPEEAESSLASAASSGGSATFPTGVTVGGQSLAGKTLPEALALCRSAMQDAVNDLQIIVQFGNDSVALSQGDFTVKDVLEETLSGLLTSGRTEKLDLAYVTDLSPAGKEKLRAAANAAAVVGKNATVAGWTPEGFAFTEEQKGSKVDMAATLQSVNRLLSLKQSGAVQASFIDVTPETTKAQLSEKFRLISSFTTESTNTSNGNSNMALALSHVNGTILQPGQVFSYNDCIGDSTDPDNGWLPAGGLSGGLLVQVYGGGICQGSTTLYGAALRAGMEIVERDCHSTPSSYCPIGLDATVDYGNIDFRFRNPLDGPVYISAWMDGVTLHVNFYGCAPEEWDDVEVYSEQTGSTPVPEEIRFITDEKLAQDEYVRKSSGNWGYTARAWRTFYKNGEAVRTEELSSSDYGASPVTYAVGPDTDTDKVDTTQESGKIDASPSPSPSAEPTPEPTEEPEPQPVPDPEPTEEPEEPVDELTPEPEVTPEPGGGWLDDPGVIDWS